jgi:hypothetical protein
MLLKDAETYEIEQWKRKEARRQHEKNVEKELNN